MSLLLVQKYLETKTIKELEIQHGVEASIFEHKVSLNYNQIKSNSSDQLANDCRGLILRSWDGSPIQENEPLGKTKVLCLAFKRFFNYGDGNCAKIDWDSIQAQEKLDGTLCLVYFDDIKNDWCVATRSVPEANLPMGFKDYTFRTLFEKAIYENYGFKWSGFTNNLDKHHTYSFELTTPLNQIVVRHKDYSAHLLAIFNNDHLLEVSNKIGLYPFKSVQIHNLSTIEEIIDFVNLRNPSEYEGLVLIDKHFNRIKVKSISYVAAHKLRDTVSSDRNCLALIMEEKLDDAIVHLPEEVQDHLNIMAKLFKQYLSSHESKYALLHAQSLINKHDLGHNEIKSFADLVSQECLKNKNINTAPLFAIKRGKAKSVLDFHRSKKIGNKYPHKMLDVILKIMGY